MTKCIPIHDIGNQRAIYLEEVSPDQPLTADLLHEMMAAQAALCEYLTDEKVIGNDSQTVTGHRHGRGFMDGGYVERHGTFNIGHLYPQSSTSTDYTAVYWEICNSGGPDSSGVEQAGTRLKLISPSIYINRAYKELVLGVLLKVASGGQAYARLSLLNGATPLVSSEASTSSTSWDFVRFVLTIQNSSAYSGWRQLKLELKTTNGSHAATIAGDDVNFKPSGTQIMNGAGLLVGEFT